MKRSLGKAQNSIMKSRCTKKETESKICKKAGIDSISEFILDVL